MSIHGYRVGEVTGLGIRNRSRRAPLDSSVEYGTTVLTPSFTLDIASGLSAIRI
jgi:hypothetical protein